MIQVLVSKHDSQCDIKLQSKRCLSKHDALQNHIGRLSALFRVREHPLRSLGKRLEDAVPRLQEATETTCAVNKLTLLSQHAKHESIFILLLEHSDPQGLTISASYGTWAT